MEKDKFNNFLDRWKAYRIKRKKDYELSKKKYLSLSMSDKLAYHQLMEKQETNLTQYFTAPISFMFWLGIWSILLSIMLGADLEIFKHIFKLLLPLAFRLTIIIAIAGLILDTINRLTLGRYSKRLLGVDNGGK